MCLPFLLMFMLLVWFKITDAEIFWVRLVLFSNWYCFE